MIEGWYYLHTNGDLIYKRELGETAADIRESSFAVGLWSFDSNDRERCWSLLVEALSTRACLQGRIEELAEKWGCSGKDAEMYAERVGVVLGEDGSSYTAHRTDFTNFQESLCGFGESRLEAMADLCKQLGYKPAKMWGKSFKELLQ